MPLVRPGIAGWRSTCRSTCCAIVREKADEERLPIDCVRANLVELDAIADGAVDYAMCLFSTLGMIRGRANRRRVLEHARRILKPGGRFVLHVHNYWYNLRDPDGPLWVLGNLLTAPLRRDVEVGDRWFPYRGLPSMFLHVFRWRELAADLRVGRLPHRRADRARRPAPARARAAVAVRRRYAPMGGSSPARRDDGGATRATRRARPSRGM